MQQRHQCNAVAEMHRDTNDTNLACIEPAPRLSMKVTEPRAANPAKNDKGSTGGAISLYGLGRFPVTLYRSQWERLIAAHEDITAFIAAHADKLATKD